MSDDPGFFQQVGLWKRSPVRRCPGVRLLKFNQVLTNISTRDVTTGVEVDSDEFSLKIFFTCQRGFKQSSVTYESGGVIIFDCLSVAEGFQNRIGFK